MSSEAKQTQLITFDSLTLKKPMEARNDMFLPKGYLREEEMSSHERGKEREEEQAATSTIPSVKELHQNLGWTRSAAGCQEGRARTLEEPNNQLAAQRVVLADMGRRIKAQGRRIAANDEKIARLVDYANESHRRIMKKLEDDRKAIVDLHRRMDLKEGRRTASYYHRCRRESPEEIQRA